MALSQGRYTPQRLDGDFNNLVNVGIKTATTLYKGGIVCVDATGYAVPGATATGLKIIGILGEQPNLLFSDRYTNSGASGAIKVDVRQGTFKLKNSGSDALTIADNGATIYIEDDETVCKTASGKSIAGRMIGLDDATSPTGPGVWFTVVSQP